MCEFCSQYSLISVANLIVFTRRHDVVRWRYIRISIPYKEICICDNGHIVYWELQKLGNQDRLYVESTRRIGESHWHFR